MYQQEKDGLYVYYYKRVYTHADDVFGHIEIVHDYYESWSSLFPRCYWQENQIWTSVGYRINDRICSAVLETHYRKGKYGGRWAIHERLCNKINCREHKESNKAVVIYDHNGKLFTPDYVIGKFRVYRITRTTPSYYYRYKRTNGRKKCAYGSHRSPRTFQERKWAHAWNDEEFTPMARGRRQGYHLPTNWDAPPSHNDKCWKTQSKRKHQWKEKKK